ncbi:type II secretion system secretin GspD [Thioalbus denitrificans]|uniref:Type II secretion system protein D (GspD) n=1 Tax=Thioalbus denitrificans TaxID=547122 RepID=A0A369CDN1_9GAMM|nr:type II secretion system secretin GspD [Thioalbus denitrificans]RCX29924.1 type II secretion system protein D (GspD) [Thioalbus denitrificans]
MIQGTTEVTTMLKPIAAALAAALLAACAAQQPQTGPERDAYYGGGEASAGSPVLAPATPRPVVEAPAAPVRRSPIIRKGTGMLVGNRGAEPVQATGPAEGDITLNFERADVQEVVGVIFGDLLGVNYVIDPEVSGTVSVQTSRPVSREALLPLVESMLRVNGAALMEDNGLYRVVPLSKAPQGAVKSRIGRQRLHAGPGYHVQVVPLQYIAATEMEKILEPFVGETGLMRVDERRNVLILSGSSQDIRSWLATIDIFDVDWLKGYSVGIFPLENAAPKTIAGELEQIIGESVGEKGGVIRVEPIERLNALLVVTPQPRYLDEVQTWVTRLDRADTGPGSQLHVYRVRNRKAGDLAGILSEVFSGRRGQREPAAPRTAPGMTAVALASAPAGEGEPAAPATPPAAGGAGGGDAGVTLLEGTDVRIVADEQNNAVLVLATAAEYLVVEAALKKLDVLPLQVLVEASIVEVTLEDELSYGLEWFFKNNSLARGQDGVGLLDLNKGDGIGSIIPGFSYALVDSAGAVNAVLNALATDSKVNVLSSPSLMVLDNRTAEIRVGEQVPVTTGREVTTGDTVLEAVQYRDTGVLLSVTPSVNAGGLVTMEINQEVTDVGDIEIVGENSQSRRFLQRNIQSTVAVQSGETIVLGGLITENKLDSERGIPGLYRIPVLGKLFGATEQSTKRTELLVLLTPQVVESQQDATEITEEFRRRLKNLQHETEQALRR